MQHRIHAANTFFIPMQPRMLVQSAGLQRLLFVRLASRSFHWQAGNTCARPRPGQPLQAASVVLLTLCDCHECVVVTRDVCIIRQVSL